jgi:prefoldin subunit 5
MSADTPTDTTDSTDSETIPLNDAGDVRLPVVELLTGRGFITGKSGSGKSNSASVVAEELLSEGFPLLIVDTDGEYYGLKEQFKLLHAGADDDCDIQVGPEHAEKLATLALEENVPIILDVSGYLNSDDADALIRETARHLFTKEKTLRKPFLLLVEEVHEYIPEGGGLDDTGEMLVKIGKRGRKHGLGLVGISQRPADVKKDFITQCDWLVWHRLTWENDTAVVRRVVSKDVADAVADLADGEAFLQTDWDEADVRRIQWRRKATFDAGATPGLEDVDRPDLKSVSGDLVDELEAISDRQERREDETERLRARLDEKDEQIADLEEELEDARDLQHLGEAFLDAVQDEDSAGAGEVDRELLEEKNETIRDLRNRVDELATERDALQSDVEDLQAEVDRLESYRDRVDQAEEIEERWNAVEEWLGNAPEALRHAGDTVDQFVASVDSRERNIDELEAELEQLREENERLEAQVEASGEVYVPSDYEAFLDDDVVREQIAAAKAAGGVSEDYVRAVVAAVLEAGDPVTFEAVLEFPDARDKSHVSRAANELADRRVVSVTETDEGRRVDFNVEGIEAIKREAKRREKRADLMEDL